MSQTSDTPETRKSCRYCGHPEANAKDWEDIEPGKGEELGLCWGGEICRHDAEAAIDRLMSERDAAREDARRLAQSMDAVVRATRLQAPLNLPVNKPMREWLPGCWPVMGECIEMSSALAAHEALTAKN